MNYKIINSGSDGNAVLINDEILIDCGVSFNKLQHCYKNLKLVLLTHIHGDHFNSTTIRKISKLRPGLRFGCCEWLVNELLNCGVSKSQIDIYNLNVEYDYKIFKIKTFNLFHDVPQCGYKVFMDDKKLIYATDTKSIDHIEAKDYDYYLIEANYTNEEDLKSYSENDVYFNRVLNTHLSQQQAAKWLLENMGDNSIYEFMHQHKEKPLAKRFLEIKPLLEKASEITRTKYELNDDSITTCIEELISHYEHKCEELRDYQDDVSDNYRFIPQEDQYDC